MLFPIRHALLVALFPSLSWAQVVPPSQDEDARGASAPAPLEEEEGQTRKGPLPAEEDGRKQRELAAFPPEQDAITDAEVERETWADEPRPEEERDFSAAPQGDAQADPDAVFRSFAVYAREERARRIAGSLGGIGLGGATIGVGAILSQTTNTDPTAFYIVGGVGAGLSLIGLLIPSPAELLARQHHVHKVGHSSEEAEAFEAKWADAAQSARRRRMTGAVMNLVVGTAGVGVGAALAAGAWNLDDMARATWGSVLVGAGAAFLVGGATGLVVQTPVESSYAEYAASKPQRVTPSLGISVGSVPSGAIIGAGGHF